jgi:hypothetical protein
VRSRKHGSGRWDERMCEEEKSLTLTLSLSRKGEAKPSVAGSVPSVQAKQLRNRAQGEETNENSCCYDDKKSSENDNNENPI